MSSSLYSFDFIIHKAFKNYKENVFLNQLFEGVWHFFRIGYMNSIVYRRSHCEKSSPLFRPFRLVIIMRIRHKERVLLPKLFLLEEQVLAKMVSLI